MKTHLLTLLFLMLGTSLFAQNNELTVFSQDGDPFFLVVNGVRKNTEPRTNIKVDALQKDIMIKLKVVFSDGVTPDIDKTIFYEKNNQLMTLSVKKTFKDGKLKKIKLQYAGLVDLNGNETVTQTSQPEENTYTSQPNNSNYSTNNTTTVTHTETTTTNTNIENGNNGVGTSVTMIDPETGENVSVGIDINISGDGISNGTTTSSSTTTTTTTVSENVNETAVEDNSYDAFPVPGYTGSVGCRGGLVNEQSVKNALASESFSDDKKTILTQATKNKCVSTDQVLTFMEEFSFESDQLEVAKMLYSKTYDQDDYYKVTNKFSFSSTKDELNEFIKNQ